jgi:predicted membrane protein
MIVLFYMVWLVNDLNYLVFWHFRLVFLFFWLLFALFYIFQVKSVCSSLLLPLFLVRNLFILQKNFIGIILGHLEMLRICPKGDDDNLERRNQYSEVTPHPDGEKESIINDSLATAGSQIGIELNADPEFTQEKNPFHQQIKQDPTMAPFEKLMRGKKVEE